MKINQRLFDHYGIDTNKDLGIKGTCSRPWDTILIDKQGSCYACECTAWLPQSIGNLQVQPLSDIIGSNMHRHLQDSIDDGTYRYCNQKQCPFIKADQDGRPDWATHRPYDIQNLRLAIDDSCNLRCPSCRNQLIFHQSGQKFRLGIRLADRVNEWLREFRERITVHIGSDGDPFASHVYRHFMEHTPRKDNIWYSILTNGLMLRDFHANVPQIISRTTKLGISIDGATEDTYERLRLGGRWNKILDGLDHAKSLKAEHGFKFELHMVVQNDNWREMEQMLELGHKHNVDRIYFNRIEDWSTKLDMAAQTFFEDREFQDKVQRLQADPITTMNL